MSTVKVNILRKADLYALVCLHLPEAMCSEQVILTNLRVDMPRHSWSPEMYTFSCAQGRFLLPVAADHVTSMTPDMTRYGNLMSCMHFAAPRAVACRCVHTCGCQG